MRVVGDKRAMDGHKRGAVDASPAMDGGGSLSAQGLSAHALVTVVHDKRAMDGHKRGAVDTLTASDGGESLSAQGLSAHALVMGDAQNTAYNPLATCMASPSYPASSRNTRASRLALARSDRTTCRCSR